MSIWDFPYSPFIFDGIFLSAFLLLYIFIFITSKGCGGATLAHSPCGTLQVDYTPQSTANGNQLTILLIELIV